MFLCSSIVCRIGIFTELCLTHVPGVSVLSSLGSQKHIVPWMHYPTTVRWIRYGTAPQYACWHPLLVVVSWDPLPNLVWGLLSCCLLFDFLSFLATSLAVDLANCFRQLVSGHRCVLWLCTGKHGVVVELGCPEHHFFSYFLPSMHATPSKMWFFPIHSDELFCHWTMCLSQDCRAPIHELWKHCPGGNGWIHMLCGWCLMEDEGEFKEDSVLCPWCDPKLKGSEALPRSTVGLKSPCHRHPSYCGPPIVEEQATQPAAHSKNKQRKTKMPPTFKIP
jgi:hypothetical protein